MAEYLWTASEWSFEIINRVYKEIERIGTQELGLTPYPAQIEIITAEQMVDAYAGNGMPIFYRHWSFGKHFSRDWELYKHGYQGLAYEIVINSDPCIAYLMEENTQTMQSLVLSHACVSGDTEYLSPIGWQRIDAYQAGKVAQYHEDGRVNFVEPEAYIKRPQTDFIHIESEKIDQAITEDHTVILVDHYNKLRTTTGAELYQQHRNKTRGMCNRFITGFHIDIENELPLSDDEICLHIAIKADGSMINPNVDKTHFDAKPDYIMRFHLKKERKIARLKMLLDKLGIAYTSKPTYEGRHSVLFRYPMIDKRFTAEWYTASYRQLKLIGEEVCYWDGSVASPNFNFTSEFKQDVEFVQYVWAATGCHGHISAGTRCVNVTKSERPLIGISKDGRLPPQPFARIPSPDGLAYCFTVPSGMFVMRRNNKISVTGNCQGHSHFFRNNYLFKEWTDASSILDYLIFARDYINQCEAREGREVVETFLNSCHALMNYGVNPYRKPRKLSLVNERKRQAEKNDYDVAHISELFDSLIKAKKDPEAKVKKFPAQPEENILWFCEKFAPDLKEWQRETIRIVRKIAQYFYPQGATKCGNEGCATYVHYRIMTRLHELGHMTDGAMLEFLQSHTNVVMQPNFNDHRYTGINPYALGFAIMKDVERICHEPTDEDRRWFPEIAGVQDEMAVIRDIWANYRDESMIRQFLSPEVIRALKLFQIHDDNGKPEYKVAAIHDDAGYQKVRDSLADQYERHNTVPQIEVSTVDPETRILTLTYTPYRGRNLDNAAAMANHVKTLWGHGVALQGGEAAILV